MTLRSMVVEFGMGTDIRGGDYTKAAVRAVRDALWHNTIAMADVFGCAREDMVVRIAIGVARPDRVDKSAVAAVLPYGTAEVSVAEGGMDTPLDDTGGITVMANAAVTVFLDLPDDRSAGAAA